MDRLLTSLWRGTPSDPTDDDHQGPCSWPIYPGFNQVQRITNFRVAQRHSDNVARASSITGKKKTGFLCPPASHAGIAGSDIAREGLALSRAPLVFLFLSYLYRLRDFVHPSLLPLPTGSDLAILPIEKVSFAVLEKSKACPGHSRLLLTDNDPMYP
ncbi:conserved hypothetical protein [Coccidioides posadasii str. Silveira]|uniref:Uncharacterized protein n=2 Tax=Coccidioides posadasii TaxID=199306 RepID=E9D372_COCPS|nr:conserved hypothetical protein [Coccidioides posadasii str. Silveira]KMM71410.1 hypothetical protein CPAG_07717 [Coccidioides posadasii RMSCC 3488]